jgi:hypothetical protein
LTPFEDVDGWKKRFNEIWRRLLLQEIRANRAHRARCAPVFAPIQWPSRRRDRARKKRLKYLLTK